MWHLTPYGYFGSLPVIKSYSEQPNWAVGISIRHSKIKFLEIHQEYPSEEFEFTANTLQAHMKTHSKLILKPLIYHTAISRDELTL